jgi:hypothetical protein
VPESRPTEMPRRALVGALRRVRITERRAGAGSDLLSQPVLLVGEKKIHDQDGRLLATFRSAASNPSFFRHVFRGVPRVFEIVDVRDRMVLMVEESSDSLKFKAIAADRSDIGTVLVKHGWRPRQVLQAADGETVGSFCWVGNRKYSVRDPQDLEVGRITHIPFSFIRRRVECNVIEINKGMSGTMRALMLPASKAVSYLNAPS